MAIPAKFNRTNAPTTPKPPPAQRARYGGIQAAAPRDPMPAEGIYKVRVDAFEEGQLVQGKDTQSVRLTIGVLESQGSRPGVDADPVGAALFIPFRVAGAGATQGKGRMKAFIVAASGFEDEESYDAYDPEGFGIDALLGYAAPEPYAGKTLVGREVYLEVTRGNKIKDRDTGLETGEYFMNYAWAPVEGETI
jgi:hypothetical protein